MTLPETQQVFSLSVAKLILHLGELGYGISMGEAYRPPQMAAIDAAEGKGITHSLHTERLALDLNLWKDGALLPYTVDAYRVAGECWKAMSTPGLTHSWGGDFSKPDCDHFSITWNGVR